MTGYLPGRDGMDEEPHAKATLTNTIVASNTTGIETTGPTATSLQ